MTLTIPPGAIAALAQGKATPALLAEALRALQGHDYFQGQPRPRDRPPDPRQPG